MPTTPFARAAAAYPDITCHQVVILGAIAQAPGGSVREYAAALGCNKPKVTRCTDKMEALGLVRRTNSVADGRLVALSVTPAGTKFLASLVSA
jgi:DNA-binding MarR family transcriptional regulator